MAALTLLTLCSTACRSRPQPDLDAGPVLAGEPESYSATVVSAIDDGAVREASVTRVARSGELRREEWTEQAGRRALIWRPDQAKAFLLDLDRRTYIELTSPFGAGRKPGASMHGTETGQAMADDDTGASHASDDSGRAVDPEAVERAVNDAPSPERVETRPLADQTIEGHVCSVSERRAIFSDGHAELTMTFRALDLGGLIIRIETSAEPRNESVKTIVSRRDIKTDVSPDEFVVPAGFRKVDKLPLR
ncbi:MAG TPA: hypothetical protein VF762_04270 [Blastocatellia bacterium]